MPLLEYLARVVSPDYVPNDFGDDPWLIAFRRMAGSDITPYLASFLLARAFGRRTRNCADLAHIGDGGVSLNRRKPLIGVGQFPLQA